VDQDSSRKLDPNTWTRVKCRQQLSSRIFQAVPLLARGTSLPALESRIQSGLDTSMSKDCAYLAEKAWDTFHPSRDSPGWPSGVVPWSQGGQSSRDIARSPKFLKQQGFRQASNGVWM
jgi:hypothetical protein